jgi:hypothetical protein
MHTGDKALFRDYAMHTDIMRRLGHARHHLYAKCQTTPIRCRRQLPQKTIIIPFAKSQTSSTRVKGNTGHGNAANLLRMDNALGPIRFQNAKTTTPELRRIIAALYRSQRISTDHWHSNTLLQLTRLCNNLPRLDFLREGHIDHDRMADAESRQGTDVRGNGSAFVLDFCRRERRPLSQEMPTQLCFCQHDFLWGKHTPYYGDLGTRSDGLQA